MDAPFGSVNHDRFFFELAYFQTFTIRLVDARGQQINRNDHPDQKSTDPVPFPLAVYMGGRGKFSMMRVGTSGAILTIFPNGSRRRGVKPKRGCFKMALHVFTICKESKDVLVPPIVSMGDSFKNA